MKNSWFDSLQPHQPPVISCPTSSELDGISCRIVEGQTHDSAKLSSDSHTDTENNKLATEVAASEGSEGTNNYGLSPAHTLRVGSTFRFRLTVLQASHVPSDYADIFCQFK